jgi:hypothetical protein
VIVSIFSAILTVATGLLAPSGPAPEAPPAPETGQQAPLRTTTIEFEPWDESPWPVLTGQAVRDQEVAVGEWVVRLAARQSSTRVPVVPFRTRFLHVGGGLPRQDMIHLGTVLDRTVQRLHALMQRPVEEMPFAGRLGLLLVPDRDAFVLMLADEFGAYVPSTTAAVLQVDGRSAIVIVDASAPRGHIDHQLDRVVAQAYLHALHAPQRLPAWANEGLATAIAWSGVEPGSRRGRTEAIAAVRDGFEFGSLFDLQYAGGTWVADERQEARAGLLLERLVADRPEQLRAWILAVKSGAPWREAFLEAFADTPEALVDWATAYFKVND